MQVTINGKVKEISAQQVTVKKLLRESHIISNTVAVIINGTIATEDDLVRENDDIHILKAISGG